MCKASKIYFNGQIVTMDKEASTVEALAVKNDKILALGSLESLSSYKDENTIMADLQGKTMLPGFIDPHSHFMLAGRIFANFVDLSPWPMGDVKSIADIKRKLKAAKKFPFLPILGFGYDDTMLEEKRHPLAKELDEVSRFNPIIISHISGHFGVVNSLVMKGLGIKKGKANPEGGVIRRDENGNPNGVLEENAFLNLMKYMPKMKEKGWFKTLAAGSDRYISKGVTTVQACGINSNEYNWLNKAIDAGHIKNRVQFFPTMGEENKEGQHFAGIKTTKSGTQTREDNMLSLGATKNFVDGSIQGFTAFLSKPYHNVIIDVPNKEEWCGYTVIDYPKFEANFIEYHKQGWQIATHGNGDGAIEFIINAAEAAQKAFPREDARHIIIHCQTVREDQLDRMEKLGMIPALFPVHTYYWGDRHRDIFLGEERANRINPCKSALDRNMPFTSHNDTVVTPIDPLLCIWSAANRITSGGKVLGAEQCVPVIEAIRSVTSNAAYQNCEEDIKGSLEVGKLADFVVLEENPLTIDPVKIKDIKVLATIVGDKIVYGAV